MNQIENASCDMRRRHLFYLVANPERKLLGFCPAAPAAGGSHWQIPHPLPLPHTRSCPLLPSGFSLAPFLFQTVPHYQATLPQLGAPGASSGTTGISRGGAEHCSFLSTAFSHRSALEIREGLGYVIKLNSYLVFGKLLNTSDLSYLLLFLHKMQR